MCSFCETRITTVPGSSREYSLELPCGNSYTFSVRAVIEGINGKESTAHITLPSDIGAVTDLSVSVISVNKSQQLDRVEKVLVLTWNEPKGVDVSDIEVSTWSTFFLPLSHTSKVALNPILHDCITLQ